MTRRYQLLVLPGDGIGPEVTTAAITVLDAALQSSDCRVDRREGLIGAAALQAGFGPLPDDTRSAALTADAVFLGAVGDPSADGEPPARRPEAGLLALRSALGVFANLRPVTIDAGLVACSPLRPERLAGTDLLVVRELLGGLYFGTPRGRTVDEAFDTMRYTRAEIERIAHVGFRAAQTRSKRLLSVDKANVLESSRLWRDVVADVARDYPDVALEHGYVDSVAMRLILEPSSIDVLLTENLFGDILSDAAAVIPGSLGLLPSASLGDGPGLFEPVHGSAPSLAGRDVANPIGAIRSVAMLARHALHRPEMAVIIESAVSAVLTDGLRTPDLGGSCGTQAFAAAVVARMQYAGVPHA